jgi:hypothetical protein
MAIEMVASYGMPVGREVFDTCVWIGRFVQEWSHADHKPEPSIVRMIYRKEEKMHLCGSVKAKDSTIRAAIIDRYGGKERAIGKKKAPGPLYGIHADVWQALAVAITCAETISERTDR